MDTNILVRFLVEDDPDQNRSAKQFLSMRTIEDPAYVSSLVIAETVWVLHRRMKFPMPTFAALLQNLLAADTLLVDYTEELDALLSSTEPHTDIADHLIAWTAQRAGCRSTKTFDVNAARKVPAMELLA